MDNDESWNAILELLVHRLMMKHLHAHPSPEATPKNGQYQKSGLPDTLFGAFCLPLVNAEREESGHVGDNVVNQ